MVISIRVHAIAACLLQNVSEIEQPALITVYNKACASKLRPSKLITCADVCVGVC